MDESKKWYDNKLKNNIWVLICIEMLYITNKQMRYIMNNGYKVGILILSLTIGYLIGNFVPFEVFKPNFAEEILTKGEYYRLMISIISAFITFLAVFIALFKDDIREIWKRPKIEFSMPKEITIEETDSLLDSESGSETIKAIRYISRIEVINKGNLPALNSEIYLDKLEFTPKDSSIAQNIECSSAALHWNGTDNSSIIIPPGGKKTINILEVTAPEKMSTPDSARTKNISKLIIGTIPNNKEHVKEKWNATFSLYAQNHNPISFSIEIEWNGLWKNRLTEFNNQFQVNKV